jgi:uncharacterized protein YjdB/predicted transcriptional regulator with HTH domain
MKALRALSAGTICLGFFLSACGSSDPVDRGAMVSIELAPMVAQLGVGEQISFNVTAHYERFGSLPLDRDLQWTSSQTEIASVDTRGRATAHAPGQTAIRVRHGELEAVAALSVAMPGAEYLDIRPPMAAVAAGRTRQFTAEAVHANGSRSTLSSEVEWSSDAPEIASVDDAGLATGLRAGSALITARMGAETATAVLSVTPPELSGMRVVPASLSLNPGEDGHLVARVFYSNDSHEDRTDGAEWVSSAPGIASVDGSGRVLALAPGSATITATAEGFQADAHIDVSNTEPLPFRVGAASSSASFLPGTACLGGYNLFCEREAEVEHDPLLAEAAAISGNGEGGFILVKTSNVGYFVAYKAGNGPNGLYDIRQRIARRLEARHGAVVISADQIVVTSDHSHHAPDTIGLWGGVSPAYMARLAEAAVSAGVEAWERRVPARLYAGSIQGPPTAGSYNRPPTDAPDREFRVLFAEDRQGRRLLTLMNYAPHATVLNSGNIDATGDWTAWASQIANETAGGVGMGLVGALGAMDWNKSGDNIEREAEARERLRSMLNQAYQARSEVQGNEVAVRTVFIREPLLQPILLLNFLPQVTLPVLDASVSIERALNPPWNNGGAALGTYASAIRLGDVFIGTMPGEPFPQLHYALRDCDSLPEGIDPSTDCGGIRGTRANFMLGAAQDFLGYMLYTPDQYFQAFANGATYFMGCPERELFDAIGIDYDTACPDHWVLMVSPTIGRHLVCTLQDAAEDLGFEVGERNPDCLLLTALDNIAAPPEYPQTGLVGPSPADFLDSPAAGLVAACRELGGDNALCDGLDTVSSIIGDLLGSIGGGGGDGGGAPGVPEQVSRAGVAIADASWHLGASAGQFAETGVGIARDAGFDPYVHSVRKVGSDILGTRITARALVVEDGDGRRVGVIANDLYLPNDFLHRRVVQLLREHDHQVQLGTKQGPITGLSKGNLAITASHSHTSPFYSTPGVGTWIFQDVMDLRFYEYIAGQMAQAAIDAVAGMVPARMGGITVHSNDVQSHTYGPRVAYDGTPAGQPYDYTTQTISVVRFDDISNPGAPKPLANWLIFGVHPEWVWGEEIVNGDLTHAVMRMLDRESGAITLWSQRETGASGPHKDTRVHPPHARREFQESNFSGYDRAARLLTDTLLDALRRIEEGRPQNPNAFVPFSSQFRVDWVSERFAPPLSQPFPGVSNCSTDPLFGDLHLGIPVLGFPDCFYDHNDPLSPIVDPLLQVLPINPENVRDQLIGLGVPVPHTYSLTSLGLVQETAAVHLQVFKLGDIVATMCPCEQFTSQALNIESRLDRVADNLWTGWDWGCLAEERGLIPVDDRYAAHCARQKARYPEAHQLPIPGSLDDPGLIARMRAQIHNDAAGWEDPANVAEAASEPLDPEAIRGNFTHEEFASHGYGLVLSVGMTNDYWGYTPEYREMRAFDHYRKALNALGPHGADYLMTRLARMAANLNGASEPMPFNPLDTVFQAESLRAEVFAQTLGTLARAYTAAWDITLPPEGGSPRVLDQPSVVPRFSAAMLRFVGGSNYTDMPDVRVERLVSGTPDNGSWETWGTQEGEVQLQLKFIDSINLGPVAIPDPAQLLAWRAGQFEWEWTASWEAFISELGNLGARPGITPLGHYRFVVEGHKRNLVGVEQYRLVSDAFEVVPWGGIRAEDLRVEDSGHVSFLVGPFSEVRDFRTGMSVGAGEISLGEDEAPYRIDAIDYPDSYEGGISWIDPRRILLRYGSDDREVHQQYCTRCSFRPWADRAELHQVQLTVRRADGSEYTLAAEPWNGRWRTSAAIAPGETAFAAPRDLIDQYGEINAAPSEEVSR